MISFRDWNDGVALFSYLLWRSSVEGRPFEEQVKFWLWTIASERGYYLPRRAWLWRFLLERVDRSRTLMIFEETLNSFKRIEGKFMEFLRREGANYRKDVRVYPGFSLEGPGGSAFDDFVVLHIGPGRDYLPILLHELIHAFFETDDEGRVLELTRKFLEGLKQG